MPPRSLNGWTNLFLSEGHTYREAERLARQRLAGQVDPEQPSLFDKDSELVPRLRGHKAKEDREAVEATNSEYDPRTSDWPEEF